MECRLDKQIKILASMCDNKCKLSVPAIFSLFMDLASEHGPMIGVSNENLAPKGLFWLTVRTKVHIYECPGMQDELTASSWPEVPGKVRCNRHYSLRNENDLMVVGKTEWAVIEIDTGKLRKVSDVYPKNIEHCSDIACSEPFVRTSDDFESCESIGTYTVRSTDIDLGQHMNNAVYVRVLFGAFSCKELEKMKINDVEIAFRSPCYEGDELSIRRRYADDGAIEIGIVRSDGVTAAVARILYQ